MAGLWKDLRFGVRSLVRKPGFAIAALLSLVLGIGTNVAIYTLLDAVFLRPLPVKEIERIVSITENLKNDAGEYTGERPISHPNYLDYRERQRVFEDVAAFHWWRVILSGGDEALRGTGMYVSENFFEILGLDPAAGRFFAAADNDLGSPPTAVLSHGAWSRLFGADPGILGETVEVNGTQLTVIGIAPRGFRGIHLESAIDVFMPLVFFERLSPYGSYFKNRSVALFWCLGKLQAGLGAEEADREMMALAQQLESEYPKDLEGLGAQAHPLAETVIMTTDRDRFTGYQRPLLIVIAILLIACLNVVNLLLVRGVERARELAVRQALGASRGRIIRQLVTENLVLFFTAGILSLPMAQFLVDFLWRFRPPQVPENALLLEPDLFIWGGSLAVTLLAGLVFGLWPALRAAPTELVSHLKETEPLSGGGRLPLWLKPRSVLVLLQVALALVSLIGAGLLLRSLQATLDIDLGFDSERLAVLSVVPGQQGYEEPQAREYYRRLLERGTSVPGATSAALSENRLLRGATLRHQVFVPGREKALEIEATAAHRTTVVSPGFFETVGIPLKKGRDFRNEEPEGALVAIVNETMAETVWPDRDPIGQRFHFDFPDTPPIEVVGVATDARYRQIQEDPQFFIYIPLAQHYVTGMTLHVRTVGDPQALLGTLRREVREIDPSLALADVYTMEHFVDEALWLERASASLLGLFGALALFLAVVGVYSLLSYSVSQRRRELAILMAIGARRGHVLLKIVFEAVVVVGLGAVVGLVLAFFGLEPLMGSQLYGVTVTDPVTYALLTLTLLAAALLGSLVPAWRAARTDPMRTLREE